MSTLYTNERAFCFLSEAEQAELIEARKEGRVVFLAGLNWSQTGAREPMAINGIYRITKPAPTKPSIDWDHVEDWVTCMATDEDGETNHWERVPELSRVGRWRSGGKCASAKGFKSFRPGTCDWRDSLVMRPGVGK